MVDSFRRTLDEDSICEMADAAVAMEEAFILDIIGDLEPTSSVCYKSGSTKRKSSRQVAQRRRPENIQADADKVHHELTSLRQDELACGSPVSSMSSDMDTSSCASSTLSGEVSSEWTMVPVVTPEQMFALGRMVKEQRSCSSVNEASVNEASITSVEAGG